VTTSSLVRENTNSWSIITDAVPIADADYIFKGVQAFKDHGVPIYMVGIQVSLSSQVRSETSPSL
jgi:hypothetical protein